MEKQRTIKNLSIIALVFAIAGMTLRFAAFSTTLNISSSATVTPNSADFKISIYGAANAEEAQKLFEGNIGLNEITKSNTLGAGFISRGSGTITNATIDNNNHTISSIKVTFEENPAKATYGFMIVNEGKYPAYLDLSTLEIIDGKRKMIWIYNGTCIPADGTTPSLVEETCKNVVQYVSIFDNNFEPIETTEDYYVIQPGEFTLLGVEVSYLRTDKLADGPFDVYFDEVTLDFTSSPSTTN